MWAWMCSWELAGTLGIVNIDSTRCQEQLIRLGLSSESDASQASMSRLN